MVYEHALSLRYSTLPVLFCLAMFLVFPGVIDVMILAQVSCLQMMIICPKSSSPSAARVSMFRCNPILPPHTTVTSIHYFASFRGFHVHTHTLILHKNITAQ